MSDVAGSSKEKAPCIWRAGCDNVANCQKAGCCLGLRSNRGAPPGPSAKELIDSLARFADHNSLCPRGQWKPQDEEDFDMPECVCGLDLLLNHANVFVQQYEPASSNEPPVNDPAACSHAFARQCVKCHKTVDDVHADEPPDSHSHKLDDIVTKIMDTHDRAGVSAVVRPILRELDRAIQVVKDYDELVKQLRASPPPSDGLEILRQLAAIDIPTTGSDRIDAYFHEAKRYAIEGLGEYSTATKDDTDV